MASSAITKLSVVAKANQQAANELASKTSKQRTVALLRKAETELNSRLAALPIDASANARAHIEETRRQIREVLKGLSGGLKQTILDNGDKAAELATGNIVDYVQKGNKAFLGVRMQVLPISEAAVLDRVRVGVRSSLLNRLSRAGEGLPGEDPDEAKDTRAKPGILARYSANTIENIEQQLQVGLLTGQSWGDLRANVVGQSPFLKGAPAYWAERLVRTECQGAYNRSGFETIKAVDDELGDVVKIVAATFDNRTGWDSYQCHGQIRLPDEPFELAGRYWQYPPNRPNDRETVIIHRIAWPIPTNLKWRSDGEVFARWKQQGRKGAPPPRPEMTTVPLDRFGKEA